MDWRWCPETGGLVQCEPESTKPSCFYDDEGDFDALIRLDVENSGGKRSLGLGHCNLILLLLDIPAVYCDECVALLYK